MDSAGNYLKDMYAYDPTADTWQSDVSSPGNKRMGALAFVYNGEAYLFGGTNEGGAAETTFDKFNQAADRWTALKDISSNTGILRTSGVAFVLDSLAYVTGGKSAINGSVNSTIWSYDCKNDVWVQHPNFPYHPLDFAVAFTINGTAWVGTGYRGYVSSGDSLSAYDNFYRFEPNVPAENGF